MTTDIPHQPQRYLIRGLLNSGVQPLPDMNDEELEALGKNIKRSGPTYNIILSSDGLLVDGHQRLRALLLQGKTYIDSKHVTVRPEINASNALEKAVELNFLRRPQPVEMKAAAARKLQKDYRWSQVKIAKHMGVSQPAVSQWLKNDTDKPESVVGTDGIKRADPSRNRPPRPKLTVHAWDLHHGDMFSMVEKLTARLRDPANWPMQPPLTDVEWDTAKARLNELVWIIAQVLGVGSDDEAVQS